MSHLPSWVFYNTLLVFLFLGLVWYVVYNDRTEP